MKNNGTVAGPAPVRRSAPVALAAPTRATLLEYLQQQAQPLDLATIAADLGLHANTLRDHLAVLIADGLVVREQAPRAGRGRPAWRYGAHPDRREPDRRVGEYAALAGALAAHVSATSSDPSADARSAGKAWGHALAAGVEPGRRDPHTVAVDLLRDYDFDPVLDRRAAGRAKTDQDSGASTPAGTRTVRLCRCPLLDVARKYPEVVCSVHEGLVAGVLAELGDTTTRVELLPFAEPNACVLRFLPAGAGATERSARR